MKKIALFASGFGSNVQAFIDSANNKTLNAEIAIVVSDSQNCYALQRAKSSNIDTFVFNPKSYSSKEIFETEIANILHQKDVELIVLAGYMRLIGKVLLAEFEGKIVNIHPSLLPAFPGLHAIEQAINYGVKVFGVTIHYVDEGMDTGRIIAQDTFIIKGDETTEEIETQIHKLEHNLYPKVVNQLLAC